MAKANYFIKTVASKWSIKNAFRLIEEETPSNTARENLQTLKCQLQDVCKTRIDPKVKKANDLLTNWKQTKRELVPKRDNKNKNTGNINNSGVYISQQQNVVINQGNGEPVRRSKRKFRRRPVQAVYADESNDSQSSGSHTWESLAKPKKKRKYRNVYLGTYYGETDFGESNEVHWKVDEHDMTNVLRNYRQISIEGAQKRKYLSVSRTLSLSYVFLLSPIDQCLLNKLEPSQQKRVMNQLKSDLPCTQVESEVVLACRDMQRIVSDGTKDQDGIGDGISRIKINTDNKNIKMAANVVSDLIPRVLNNNQSYIRQQGEATHISNHVRPYIERIMISKLEGIKSEWLTYHFENDNGPSLLPDVVLYVEQSSAISYELFFMEVKRKGNFANNSLERDTVKIGKEMAIALNKLVKRRIKDPAVCGLVVEDHLCVMYKMDLMFNGQYRMIEISRFHIASDNSGDILLLPVILDKFNQAVDIIQNTLTQIYQRANDSEEAEDRTSFIRKVCQNPVAVDQNQIP